MFHNTIIYEILQMICIQSNLGLLNRQFVFKSNKYHLYTYVKRSL